MPHRGYLYAFFFVFVSAMLARNEAEIRIELAKQRAELSALSAKEGETNAVLDALSKQIFLNNALLKELGERDSALSMRLKKLEDSLAFRSAQLDSARALQEKVVVAMFKRGRAGDWMFLLGGRGIGDFVSRFAYFVFLAEERAKLSAEIDRSVAEIKEIADSTASVKKIVSATRAQKSAELDSLDRTRKQKQKLLEQIISDKKSYQKAIEQLELSLKELAERLPVPTLSGDFSKNKGKLPWPCESRKILYPFGMVRESRFGTQFRNAGIDISTPPEANVHAVADGKVAQIYWLRGYGQIIIIEHPGGFFSVYGNLGEVEVELNNTVRAGDIIGKTAQDGWLEGPKLHFEIRDGRKEVNPIEWLAKK